MRTCVCSVCVIFRGLHRTSSATCSRALATAPSHLCLRLSRPDRSMCIPSRRGLRHPRQHLGGCLYHIRSFLSLALSTFFCLDLAADAADQRATDGGHGLMHVYGTNIIITCAFSDIFFLSLDSIFSKIPFAANLLFYGMIVVVDDKNCSSE